MKNLRQFVDSYFSRRTFPFWCVLLWDCTVLLLSSFFIYWSFYHLTAIAQNFWPLMRMLALCIAIHAIFFVGFKTYSGIIRYSSFQDLLRIAYAMFCSMVCVTLLHLITNNCPPTLFAHIQMRMIFTTECIATGVMWASRIIIRRVYDVYFRTAGARGALVYGVHDESISLAKGIRCERPLRYDVKGFISSTDSHDQHSLRLIGLPVLHRDELARALKGSDTAAVLVPRELIASLRADTDLQNTIIAAGAQILVTGDVIAGSESRISETLREVSVEELLPRDEINVDLTEVGNALRGRRILITGSAGSIGSEIVRQVAGFGPEALMLIDAAETPQHDIRLMMAHDFPGVKNETVVTSITNAPRMEHIFAGFRPHYVFHAAAYKHVPMMEDNPSESIENNVRGTKILADLSVKYGVERFVMVSTDKAVNPTNVMGCSKRICEIYVQSLFKAEASGAVPGSTAFITTRFGNVLGSNGSVIPLFRKQIKEGGPVTVTDPNIIRYFMLIPEACKLVLEAGTRGTGGEIFLFDMGKPVRIADLAQRMIKLSGAKDVKIEYTGLRDGEKLYEELLSDLEATRPSFHPKIRIADVREYGWDDVSSAVDALIECARGYDDMATVAAMKRLVPEFKSNHSKYESLDRA